MAGVVGAPRVTWYRLEGEQDLLSFDLTGFPSQFPGCLPPFACSQCGITRCLGPRLLSPLYSSPQMMSGPMASHFHLRSVRPMIVAGWTSSSRCRLGCRQRLRQGFWGMALLRACSMGKGTEGGRIG